MFYEKYALVKRGVFKTYYLRQPLSLPDETAIKEYERYYAETDGIFLK
jgi:hypothetical protein